MSDNPHLLFHDAGPNPTPDNDLGGDQVTDSSYLDPDQQDGWRITFLRAMQSALGDDFDETDLDSLAKTIAATNVANADAVGKFVKASAIDPQKWHRICTVDGLSSEGGDALTLLLSNDGNYGNPDRFTYLIVFGQRGDNYIADIQSLTSGADGMQFYVRQVDTYVYELWSRTGSSYNRSPGVVLLSKQRSNSSVLQCDSASDSAPSGLNSDPEPIKKSWNSGNTTTDSNGALKPASPIFRLATDVDSVINDQFTAAGAGGANGEAEGVTAEHTDTGVYVVSGSLGFATDGVWPIPWVIPQDGNGNNLVFVETEQADDGTLTIKTYSRKFDVSTASVVADEPMDIPDGRWVDLRLKMPEPNDSEAE